MSKAMTKVALGLNQCTATLVKKGKEEQEKKQMKRIAKGMMVLGALSSLIQPPQESNETSA
jgi:hypothetical protein